PLEARAQREMFALDLLRVALAGAVDFGGEVPFVGPPGIGIGAPDAKGLAQCLQLHKDLVCAPTKDVRYCLPAAVIDGVAQPRLPAPLAHEAQPFGVSCSVHALQDDLDVTRV